MTCGIYMIQNKVNNKIYIGQSVDIESRWGNHKKELKSNRHHNSHLQNSWNINGEDNFEFTIICECDENQLSTFEQYYIFELMSYDRIVGYNNEYGGKSGRPTKEARKKMSESSKGKTPSEETRKKLSEAGKGRIFSEETRKKISEAEKGKTVSEESRKKMSEAHRGKTLPEETRKKLSEALKGKYTGENSPMYGKRGFKNPKAIPVVQLTLEGELVNVYGSSMEAERCGFSQGNIGSCCRGERNTHRGYIWMYLHEYKTLSSEAIKKICEIKGEAGKRKNNPVPIPVVQLTLEGEMVTIYSSAGEAEREGFSHQTIGRCVKGKLKKHKGYKWMYLSEYEAMKKEGLEK